MTGYAVIDFETTGLFPQKHDRVVEVAVVTLDEDGRVQAEWSSLVNPGRDVGPTHIHGIGAREVLAAPTFADLVPRLLADIGGRTIVAHNVRFELLFLVYELTRAGLELPTPLTTGLCTMELSTQHLRAVSRRLADCCDAAGVSLVHSHTAASDARATAALFALFVAARRPPAWWRDLGPTRAYRWPRPPREDRVVGLVARSDVVVRPPSAWLDRIVAGMPRHPDARIESYLELLEMALLDRYLSAYEEDSLVQTAVLLGLDPSSLRDIHRTYLHGLARIAMSDGIVTQDERDDLDSVARILGLSEADVSSLLTADPFRGSPSRTVVADLAPGDRVCLTGSMSLSREEMTALVTARGLHVGGLTKNTRLLVAADPDSQSGKAAKARAYGVPVVTEEYFLGRLRLLEDELG